MFTRVVEVTSKSGKAKELSNTINEKVLPILKKQTGFVDETVLVSDTESTRILGLSFWNSKEDAERYHREHSQDRFRESRLRHWVGASQSAAGERSASPAFDF
jgi:heme-degrading monooxygenase HmoA